LLYLESPNGECFQLKTPLVYLTEADRTWGRDGSHLYGRRKE
jgi:hypothetical protein